MFLTAAPTSAPTPTVVLTVAPTPGPFPVATVIVSGLGQHDAFDWWANIWIPAVAGVGTLLVSAVSLIVAGLALSAANAANKQQHEQHAEVRRQKRFDLLPLFLRSFRRRLLLEVKPQAKVTETERDAELELEARLFALPDPRGAELWQWLTMHASQAAESEDAFFKARVAGSILIQEWADDPASADDVLGEDGFTAGFRSF